MVDLDIFQGDDKTIALTVTDSAGAVVDITGFTIKFTVKKFKSDSSNVLQKVTPSDVTITDGVNGLAEIYLVPADTNAAPLVGEYVYDVEVTTLAPKVHTIATGRFTVKLDVT